MNPKFEQLAIQLHKVGAFKDRRQSPEGKGFRLKLHETRPDAPLSPFYLNLRTDDNPKPGPLTPEILEEIGTRFYELVVECLLDYSCVAGVPNAGNPLADALFWATPQNRLVRRLKLGKEDTAAGRRVVGISRGLFRNGDVALVVDDLITGADSKFEAIGVLEKAGLHVRDVLVIVDREQGGKFQLAERDYALHCLFTITELLDFYRRIGRLDQSMYEEIGQYLVNDAVLRLKAQSWGGHND